MLPSVILTLAGFAPISILDYSLAETSGNMPVRVPARKGDSQFPRKFGYALGALSF